MNGGREIAQSLGIGPFVIGATVVAVGTSVPELSTAIIAKLRGHDEVWDEVLTALVLGAIAGVVLTLCRYLAPHRVRRWVISADWHT